MVPTTRLGPATKVGPSISMHGTMESVWIYSCILQWGLRTYSSVRDQAESSVLEGTWPEQMVDLAICCSEHDVSMCFCEHGRTLLMSWRSWPEPVSRVVDMLNLIGDVCPGEWTKIFDPMQTRDETLPPWWGLVGVGRKLDGEAGNVCIKGDAFSHTPNTCAASECMGQDPGILRGRILARLRIRGMRSFNKTRRPKLRILILDSAGPACASSACKSCNGLSFRSSCRMFVLVPGDNLVESWYESRSLGHVVCGEQ
ncbi:hypothetical protein YC2023_117245 [Brassica napus]